MASQVLTAREEHASALRETEQHSKRADAHKAERERLEQDFKRMKKLADEYGKKAKSKEAEHAAKASTKSHKPSKPSKAEEEREQQEQEQAAKAKKPPKNVHEEVRMFKKDVLGDVDRIIFSRTNGRARLKALEKKRG